MRGEHSSCAKGFEVPRKHQRHRSVASLGILKSGTQMRQKEWRRIGGEPGMEVGAKTEEARRRRRRAVFTRT
eukprot:5920452-Pleurochrysis_carterae.AAC.1